MIIYQIRQKINKLKSTIGLFPQDALLRFERNYVMIKNLTNFKEAVDSVTNKKI